MPATPEPAPEPAKPAVKLAEPAPEPWSPDAQPGAVAPAAEVTPTVKQPVVAETVPAIASSTPAPEPTPSRWAGSSITYRNLVSMPTLAPAYEQTYNPNYANALLILPQFRLTDRLSLRGWQYTTLELTQADDTNRNHEVVLSDTIVTLAGSVVKAKDNSLGASVTVSGNVALPTSKSSQARTLYFGTGLGAAFGLKRGPFSLSYSTRGTLNVYRSQVGEIEKPWIQQCSGLSEGCDPFVTNGRRNAKWSALNIASLAWAPKEWLSFSASAGMIHSLLYPQRSSQVQVATGTAQVEVARENTDLRVLMYWGLGAEFQVGKGIGLGIGAETYNPQLSLNSTYESAFINRYTSFYLDVQIDPDKLLQAIR